MAIRNIRKNLAGMEDLLQGVGTEEQARGNSTFILGKIDTPYAIDSIAKMQALDVTLFTRARVYSSTTTFTDYILDPLDVTGILPTEGAGSWINVSLERRITKDTIAAITADDDLASFAGGFVRAANNNVGVSIDALYLIELGAGTADGGQVFNSDTPGLFHITLQSNDGVVTPDHYNAAGDGATDDATALTAYLTSGLTSFDWPGRTYASSVSVLILDGQSHQFNGTKLKALTAAMSLLYADSVSDWGITGELKLEGTADGSAEASPTAETMLRVRDCRRYVVENVTPTDTLGRGFFFQANIDSTLRGEKGRITGCNAYRCQTGWLVDADTGSEFNSFAACGASGNFIGVEIGAGNTGWVGGTIVDNAGGVTLLPGANHAHGMMLGVNINHNAAWNVRADDIANGFDFVGCHFYGDGSDAGRIELNNSQGIMLTGGDLSCHVQNNVGAGTITGTNQVNGMMIGANASFTGDDTGRILGTNNMGLGAVLANNFNKSPVIVNPTLLNSWVTAASRRIPGYYFDAATGRVGLVGIAASGTGVIFVLPVGFRPSDTLEMAVNANSAYGSLLIDTSGNVTYINGSTAKFSLEGLSFPIR